MGAVVERARDAAIEAIAFGDLFLEDIRDWRRQQLAGSGLEALFPIWCGAAGTAALARRMTAAGLRAVITCVDTRQLDPAWAGHCYDEHFLDALPATVDPCGENGEFHTFCTHADCFAAPLAVDAGATWRRDGFVYCALAPSQPGVAS